MILNLRTRDVMRISRLAYYCIAALRRHNVLYCCSKVNVVAQEKKKTIKNKTECKSFYVSWEVQRIRAKKNPQY